MNTILVIEDNYQNARLAEKILVRAGYNVVLAEDGETGLQQAIGITPILILADMGLPDIDGQTVVALLNQQDHLKGIPIVAYTAWPEATALQMAKSYGCQGIITKPLNTRTFISEIKTFLKASHN